MQNSVTLERKREIERLYSEIRGLWDGIQEPAKEKAARIGALLLEEKEATPHGKWLEWVEENCPFSQQQANTYMRMAAQAQSNELPATGSLVDMARVFSFQKARQAIAGKAEPMSEPTVITPVSKLIAYFSDERMTTIRAIAAQALVHEIDRLIAHLSRRKAELCKKFNFQSSYGQK